MIRPKLMYASDKAVRDALIKRKFTNNELRKLFLSRGILASTESSRESLAFYFSRLNHDYYDHKLIGSLIGNIYRKEKTSITYVNEDISVDKVESTLHEIATELQGEGDQTNIKFLPEDKGIELNIDYTQIDYGKSEFSQIMNKDAKITIENTAEGLSIRWPLNDYVYDVKERIIDGLNKIKKKEIGIKEFELSTILDPYFRTKFFTTLIQSMDGYLVHDVKDVYVYHPKDSNDDDPDDIGVHISKASLKGENVLKSEELLSLYDKGFYIYKIVWVAKTDSVTSHLYEFEAQFSDAENCKIFSYLIKGVYKFKEDGGHVKSKRPVSVLREPKLFNLIEQAAQKALTKIKDASKKGTENENKEAEVA